MKKIAMVLGHDLLIPNEDTRVYREAIALINAGYEVTVFCWSRRLEKYDTQWEVEKDGIKVVRIFNTYGPNMQVSDGRVISNIITQSLKNEDITVYGDGKQTRSFCYVDDLIEGLISLMDSDFDKPINLGNPSESTIAELAEIVLDLTNSSSIVINRGRPVDDPNQRQPDISLAREILDWSPKTDLKRGLQQTIDYFKELE